jgi:hypothetical protein
MTKEKEIQILQSLKGDTYFAQMFGDDIDRMCENISMDIAIECGCKFNTKAEILQKELKDLKEKAKTEMLLFACGIVEALSENNIEGAMTYAEKQDYINSEEEYRLLLNRLRV